MRVAPGTPKTEKNKVKDETKTQFSLIQTTENNSLDIGGQNDPFGVNERGKLLLEKHLRQEVGPDNLNNPLNSKIDKQRGAFADESTGLYFELHLDKPPKQTTDIQKAYLIFPGTGVPGMVAMQWKNNIQNILGVGGVPPAYEQAAKLTNLILVNLQKSHPSIELELVGHSLGGGIANYVGLTHGLKSTCFNAAGLGKACMNVLGTVSQDKLNKQTHVRVKGDWLSSTKILEKIRQALPRLIPSTPRQMGNVLIIEPSKDRRMHNLRDLHTTDGLVHFYENAGVMSNATYVDPSALA